MNYEFNEKEQDLEACILEIYNKETLELEHTIPASNFEEDWLGLCKVIEVAKLSEEEYLIIYYKDFDFRDEINVCICNVAKETFRRLKTIEEEGKIVNLKFHGNQKTISYDVIINEDASDKDEWISRHYFLTDDFKELVKEQESVSVKLYEDEFENKVQVRHYDIGIDYRCENKGFLKLTEHITLYDRIGKKEAEDGSYGMTAIYTLIIVSELDLVVSLGKNGKSGGEKLKVYKKGENGFDLVLEMEATDEASLRYDKEFKTVIFSDLKDTTLIIEN